MMFEMAARNGVKLRHGSVRELREPYDFADLQSILDLYYEGTQVMLYERDFYQLTWAYLKKASSRGVTRGDGELLQGVVLEQGREEQTASRTRLLLRDVSANKISSPLILALPYRPSTPYPGASIRSHVLHRLYSVTEGGFSSTREGGDRPLPPSCGSAQENHSISSQV
jgi:hypothetical protein